MLLRGGVFSMALVAVALTGCGDAATTSDPKTSAILATLREHTAAAVENDQSRTCATLTRKLQRSEIALLRAGLPAIPKTAKCAAAFTELDRYLRARNVDLSTARAAARAAAKAARDGDRVGIDFTDTGATIIDTDTTLDGYELTKKNGTWLINSYGTATATLR